MKFSTEQLVPLTELQRGPGKVMEKLQSSQAPLLILDRGRPVALLTSYKEKEKGDEGEERKKVLLQALSEMLPLLTEGYHPEKVILFGSLAKNQVHEGSDLDLCIIKKTTQRPIDRQRELVRLIRPTVATDFFVFTPEELKRGLEEKRSFFQQEIMREGKVLYEKTSP